MQTSTSKPITPWLMLISRALLFLLFQGLITLLLFLIARARPWEESSRWWLGMYMPFALFAGLFIKLRPSLLPYFAGIHALIDISTLSVYWTV